MTNRLSHRLQHMLPQRSAQRPAPPQPAPSDGEQPAARATDGLDSPVVLELPATGIAVSAAQTWRAMLRTAGAWLLLVTVLLVSFSGTVLLRGVNLNNSFDIFVDEANYVSIAQGVREVSRPETFEGPFYLHPPAFFYLQAAYLELMQPADNLVAQLYAARFLNVLLAGLSAVLIFLIARRIAGLGAATAATLIFAFEPWLIRINSRNYLETAAVFWILAGYAVLVYNARARRHWSTVGLVGVAFGLAVMTKELTVFTTLLPLGICFVFGWAYRRSTLFLAGVTAAAVYALYPLLVWLNGQWEEFAWQKLSGILRLSGVSVSTGFSRGAGQSFADAVLQNLGQFATTYLIIGLGMLATAALVFRRSPEHRVLMAWAACAYLSQSFSVLAGTNEEHLFYYLVVPALLACSVVAAQLLGYVRRVGRVPRWATGLGVLVALLYIGWSSAQWVVRHTTPDNGTERILSYMEQNVAPDSRIAATTMTLDWVLQEEEWTTGRWASLDEMCANQADFVVISSLLVETGQDIATPELSAWLALNAEPVFAFEGPSTGILSLYRLPATACSATINEAGYSR